MERTPLADNLLKRFLRYVVIDTMSDRHVTDRRPSTLGQLDLLRLLEKECRELGLQDITVDPNGYLVVRIPQNLPPGAKAPTVGFMAHVDTADDVMGNGVKPRVIDSYQGGDIPLSGQYTILAGKNPELVKYLGTTLVVTDGNTLLGSDDKSGVAILMAVAETLVKTPTIPHGEIELIFTCDEETGNGMDFFPTGLLHSRCCYTIDGGTRDEIEAECFNAVTVEVGFTGIPAHLGAARGTMVNSITMAVAFIGALPQSESPEATDGRYGYYCAYEIKGSTEHTQVTFYLRDFELEVLKRRVSVLKNLGTTLELMFPGGKVEVAVKYVYYNMHDAIQKDPHVMEAVSEAGRRLGLNLVQQIIRGGTDGARLAQMGIPAPNIFTGGHNLHSRFEWAALSAMEDCERLVEQIIGYWGEVRM